MSQAGTLTPPVGAWWEDATFEGELFLPGQSSLDTEGQALLESMASAVDQGNVSIPPMPAVAMDLVKLMRRPDSDLDAVADKIKLDAAMTAQVLRFANSSLFGARHSIDNVHHAASYLGIKRLKTVILEAALKKLSGDLRAEAYAKMEWQYSLAAASIARGLGRRRGLDPETCYLAGLLHDIGRLPLLQDLDQRGKLGDVPSADDPVDIIVEALHRGVGKQVAQTWELPPAITDAIGNHLTGRFADEDSLAQFDSTRMAEAAGDLCIALGIGRHQRRFDVLGSPSFVDLRLSREVLVDFFQTELPEILVEVAALSS
ncbi:MAG: HDOD domain-containing protein [Planctomycetota bacterium]